MSENWDELKRLFNEALNRPPSQWPDFVAGVAARDTVLAGELDALLRSHETSTALLDSPLTAHISLGRLNCLSPGSRLGPYEIGELLGAGGMGEVYRAHDPRLGRDVAIKVILAEWATNPNRLARFEQEARTVGQLNHQNIVAVYDVGTHEGSLFLVTELLEGSTLRERLAAGPLPISKALDYARQLARGIAAAQDKGIVHRDLKPENVFITRDDQLKILDFGLAKFVVQAPPNTALATTPGMIVGTIGYLAPEQVRGQPADQRADIFAFGAILYEMVSGNRAFQGDSAADTMAAVLNSDPPGLALTIPNLPPGIEVVARRCLQKDPAARFSSAHDLISALELPAGAIDIPGRAPAVVLSRPSRRRVWLALAAFIVVTAVAFVARWWVIGARSKTLADRAAADARARVVAVLPLRNISADATQAYFSSGMTEEIRGQLSKISSLRVLSRNSVARYADAKPDRIAQELSAGSIVEGSVRLDQGHVRISVQLVDTRTEQSLWSEQYDREFHDIFAVQTDVAKQIAAALKATLSQSERTQVEKRPTSNLDAYQLYLKSSDLPLSDRKQNQAAIEMLQKAVEMDPTFAVAQAKLAYRTLFLGLYGEATQINQAITLADRALRIDPSLSSAYVAKATALNMLGRQSDAKLAFFRAMEFNASDTASMENLSLLELERGQSDQALLWARRSFLIPPDRPTTYYHIGAVLLSLNDDGATARWLAQAQERFPQNVRLKILQIIFDYLLAKPALALSQARALVAAQPGNEEALALLSELLYLTEAPDAVTLAKDQFQRSLLLAT